MITPAKMALDRKARAIAYWAAAGFLLVEAIFLPLALGKVQAIWISFLLLAVARGFQLAGSNSWQAAKYADAGAQGEEQVAETLSQLGDDWIVERNYPAEHLGDIDFLVTAPSGKVFTVEAKSHRGLILQDFEGVYRRKGFDILRFQRDLIRTSNEQAAYAQQELGHDDIVPVIVFSRAEIGIPNRCIDGVFILKLSELNAFLKRGTLPPPRSHRTGRKSTGSLQKTTK